MTTEEADSVEEDTQNLLLCEKLFLADGCGEQMPLFIAWKPQVFH